MKLKHKKTSQNNLYVIPVKVLKENADFLIEYLYIFFNKVTELSKFPSWLKNANITANITEIRKRTIDQSVFSR